jgi:hypothetical protein
MRRLHRKVHDLKSPPTTSIRGVDRSAHRREHELRAQRATEHPECDVLWNRRPVRRPRAVRGRTVGQRRAHFTKQQLRFAVTATPNLNRAELRRASRDAPQSPSPHCPAAIGNPKKILAPVGWGIKTAPLRPPALKAAPAPAPLRNPKNLGEAWRSLAPWRQKHPTPSNTAAVTMPARRGRTVALLLDAAPTAGLPAQRARPRVRTHQFGQGEAAKVAGLAAISALWRDFAIRAGGPLAGSGDRAQFAARVGPVTQQSAGTGQSPHTSGAGAARAVRGGLHAHVLVG